ncbi:hypothetical protein L226DRAFT_567573 [Lentinus tigrinus ALCF2SS1-7]|uniref:uncharacterized protein n=1 Tax=Lentinus tigrinus ALCF2SS1-7 TaxID=1328758 RepID=UPI0011663535|nr:hypothetical protein L226DRAFT_567573 [Lentinus tigrinus ALCF2SS1-7]
MSLGHAMTTKLEDRVYSLMGIFRVNMPAIYGEGDRAFISTARPGSGEPNVPPARISHRVKLTFGTLTTY